jgi:catechol 2,3-dioxygenase-like lactoylglutathione lyase family enzyme
VTGLLDHVTICASERGDSETFYRTVLGALGIEPTYVGGDRIEWDDFSLTGAHEGQPPTRHVHLGFVAWSREKVDRVWRAGLDAGYRDEGPPDNRQRYSPSYYGAFLLDPDGNSVEAVHHEDVRRGGHIDHLWIGVRNLDASVAFYDRIARHTGLRRGRRWQEGGQQFRGAWATFSLMQDGRPPTEGLRIAFPALDRQTVKEFHRAATEAGYLDDGAPSVRGQYHADCYSACVLDPDGTNVESVFHECCAPSG